MNGKCCVCEKGNNAGATVGDSSHRPDKPVLHPWKWVKWCWRVIRTGSKSLEPRGPRAKFSDPLSPETAAFLL